VRGIRRSEWKGCSYLACGWSVCDSSVTHTWNFCNSVGFRIVSGLMHSG
jgi:hypothetical protein